MKEQIQLIVTTLILNALYILLLLLSFEIEFSGIFVGLGICIILLEIWNYAKLKTWFRPIQFILAHLVSIVIIFVSVTAYIRTNESQLLIELMYIMCIPSVISFVSSALIMGIDWIISKKKE